MARLPSSDWYERLLERPAFARTVSEMLAADLELSQPGRRSFRRAAGAAPGRDRCMTEKPPAPLRSDSEAALRQAASSTAQAPQSALCPTRASP